MVLSQTPWEQSLGPAHRPTDGSGLQGLHPCEALSLGPLSVKWERLYLPGSYSGPGEGGGVGDGGRVCSAEGSPQPLGPQDQVLGARGLNDCFQS